MRFMRCILLSGLFAISAMIAPSAWAIVCNARGCIYDEQGDAGDQTTAQPTFDTLGEPGATESQLGIFGNLGSIDASGVTDASDAFSFEVGARLDVFVEAIIGGTASINLELWNAALTNLAQSSGSSGLEGAFFGPITLDPGTYIIEIELAASPDPDYTIQLTGTPSAVVPEPATLCLFGLGLAGLGLSRRRLT